MQQNNKGDLCTQEKALLQYLQAIWKLGGRRISKSSNIYSSALHFDTVKYRIKKGHTHMPRLLSTPSVNERAARSMRINLDKNVQRRI